MLIQYSAPTVLSLLVNSLYIVVDRIFIGNIPEVGALALTRVGLTMPIIMVVLALSALISMGASSNISINLGKGEKEEAENTAGNAITLSVVFGFIITILFLIFNNQILGLLRIQDQTLFYAKEYITVCMLNIGLDAFFIQVLHMGIRGAATATVLSQFVTVVLGLSYFMKGKPSLELIRNNFKLYPVTLKPEGYMIFTAISKEAPMFGKGKQLDKDYFEIMEGIKMFFYDSDSIKQEFKEYGL